MTSYVFRSGDLYFLVQQFCLVSPTVSNRKASYFGYLFSFTLQVTSYVFRSGDLYFMVQQFCLVSPTVSNRKASYFEYLFSLTLQVTSNLLGQVIYISWSSNFALYLPLYQIERHHTLDNCSVIVNDLIQIKVTMTFRSWSSALPYISDSF